LGSFLPARRGLLFTAPAGQEQCGTDQDSWNNGYGFHRQYHSFIF
jgi:hypothetical protein